MINRIPYGRNKPMVGGQLNLSHPLARGLVVRWLFNEQGGTRLNDISGRGNHGTLINGPVWNNRTLSFDGGNDYVSLGDITSAFTNQEATFTVWVKRNLHTPLSQENTGSWSFNNQAWGSHYVWTNGQIYDGSFKYERTDVGAGIVSDRTQWHHIAITRKSGENGWKFYQNGIEIASASGGTWQMNTSIKIGQSSTSPGYPDFYFTGLLDDIRIYNRALSAQEVRELYVNPYADMLMPRNRNFAQPALFRKYGFFHAA